MTTLVTPTVTEQHLERNLGLLKRLNSIASEAARSPLSGRSKSRLQRRVEVSSHGSAAGRAYARLARVIRS